MDSNKGTEEEIRAADEEVTAASDEIERCEVSASNKGQLISESLFDNLEFSKKPMKNLTDFCPRI